MLIVAFDLPPLPYDLAEPSVLYRRYIKSRYRGADFYIASVYYIVSIEFDLINALLIRVPRIDITISSTAAKKLCYIENL